MNDSPIRSPDPKVLASEPRFTGYRGTKSLVTGGLGFIGSNLVHALHLLGSRVIVIDSLLLGGGGNRFNLDGIDEDVDLCIADLRDEAMIGAAVKGSDFIFNLAADSSHLGSLSDPFRDLDGNVRAQLVFLESVRQHAPEARVVYAGTRSAYGLIQSRPVNESHPLIPTEINSANRAAADLYHIAYHYAHGLRTSTLRLTNTYGPRMLLRQPQAFINWFVRLAVEGGTIKLYGTGEQLRDLEFVDDTVRGFLLTAITPEAIGQTFNLGSGESVSLREIAETLLTLSGHGSIEYVPFPDDARRIEIGDYVADTTRIWAACGWKAEVPLRDGLERSLRYFIRFREHYW